MLSLSDAQCHGRRQPARVPYLVQSPELSVDDWKVHLVLRGTRAGVMPKEDLDKVMALVAKFPKCWVFSDEIYSQLTYDGETALAGAALFHSYASGQAKIIFDLV